MSQNKLSFITSYLLSLNIAQGKRLGLILRFHEKPNVTQNTKAFKSEEPMLFNNT